MPFNVAMRRSPGVVQKKRSCTVVIVTRRAIVENMEAEDAVCAKGRLG